MEPERTPSVDRSADGAAADGRSPIEALLVESSPFEAMRIAEALGAPSVTPVKVAHTDRLAGALARLERERFDVILLDLHLPDGSGHETFACVSRHAPGVPIIVIARATGDEGLVLRTMREGAQGCFLKGVIAGPGLPLIVHAAVERHRVRLASEALSLVDERTR